MTRPSRALPVLIFTHSPGHGVGETALPPSGRVVSVRLEESMIERLAALVERVGRARRFYLRLLIGAMSSAPEDTHWHQVVTHCEDDALYR